MTDDARPGTRLQRLGYGEPGGVSLRRKPAELAELSPLHLKLITYMVHGTDDDAVRQVKRSERKTIDGQKVTIERQLEPGEPLELNEAATLLRIRLRNARELFGYRVFQAELAKEVQRLRESARPKAMQTLIELANDPGQGKAADRKVQLEANQVILGEAVTPQPNVSVTVNNQVVTPGYVIDLSPPDPFETKIKGIG